MPGVSNLLQLPLGFCASCPRYVSCGKENALHLPLMVYSTHKDGDFGDGLLGLRPRIAWSNLEGRGFTPQLAAAMAGDRYPLGNPVLGVVL